jgi:two-component system, NtrC family, nitrogen regulation sensor histidine kinase NtrY
MSNYNRYRNLVLALALLLFGVLTQGNILFPRFDNAYAQKFQKVFANKEGELQNYIGYVEKTLKTEKSFAEVQNKLARFYGLLDKEGFGIFVYKKDSLVYWSDNSIVINSIFPFNDGSKKYLNLKNAWFVPKIRQIGIYKIVGLIHIKQVYKYENKYLENEFQRDFNFPSTVKISSRQVEDGYPIFNSDGMYIFSLVFDNTCQHPLFQQYFPVLSYFGAILLFGFFVVGAIEQVKNLRKKKIISLTVIILSFVLKYLASAYQFPNIFYELDLFQPQNMAINQIIPSLGDLILWCLALFFAVYLLYKNFKPYRVHSYSKLSKYIFVSIVSLFISLAFLSMNSLLKNMIFNSSISFEANKVLLLTFYSFLGYLTIMMLFVSFGFVVDCLTGIISDITNFKTFVIIFSVVQGITYLTYDLITGSFEFFPIIFILLLVLLIGYFRIKLKTSYQFSGLVIIVFLFSTYTVDRVLELTLIKTRSETKVLASNLSNQHDQVAEYMFEDFSAKISKDSVVSNILFAPFIDELSLKDYLDKNYFSGYFDKFNLQTIPCHETDTLYFTPPDNYYQHCKTYFASLVETDGTKLPSSSFYHIDDLSGRVSYLGWFEYAKPNAPDTMYLFIKLDSKVITDKLGYPELLLDKKISQKSKFKDYSYAKYYNGTLVSKYGYYPYDLSSKEFSAFADKSQYSKKRINAYNHLVYKFDKSDLIVVSYPKVGFFEVLIAFSWTFLFYMLIVTFISIIANFPILQQVFKPDFRNKIQFAIMSVLFSSLILIGGGTIYFSLRQDTNRQHETLEEKMRSIYAEVIQRIGNEGPLSAGWQQFPYENLNDLLVKFSNVFYADINLYDPDGNLVATSRPEIFEKSLIGTKINPVAYFELSYNRRAQFIQSEKIGKMNYLSGYIPLFNPDNRLIGYLNIPYFIRQEELKHDISTLVAGIVNVYVILLLVSILISVIISRRITLPLRFIQEKFSEINLVHSYDEIGYSGNDEIGGLVKEYNRMVKELEKSIELLAKSERESAWREMARQIAHEINNPLTPMKLSVQHLLRAHNDKSAKFDDMLERISQTLIEEIDNLSSIASEFSNFAKMPQAQNDRFNLIERINNVVNLFSNSEVDFNLDFHNLKTVEVFADKEQISRVFINLFKNAIQAVDKGMQPIININLYLEKNKAVVKVTDNGNGIAEELRDKMFRPNFTTKSSGMGLGLAISKNIIEDIGGSIWFVTETGKGTTFVVEFPVNYK